MEQMTQKEQIETCIKLIVIQQRIIDVFLLSTPQKFAEEIKGWQKEIDNLLRATR